MRVVIAGPPHSGKSVFLDGLSKDLPRSDRYLFRACPDGEGSWTWKNEAASAFRRKGSFTKEMVQWYIDKLCTCDLAPIVLVDVGGRMSSENRRIISEGKVDAAIILSGDPEAINEWENFCRDCGCDILASIHSNYTGKEDDIDSSPMSVHYLERGQDVSSRPVILKIAAMILDMAKRKEVDEMKSTIKIDSIARDLGKVSQEKVLPNGRKVSQITWEGSDLIAISRLFHNRSGELGEVMDIDGPAPAWLISSLVHTLHPLECRVNSPDGMIPIGCQKPSGGGYGENLEFFVAEKEGWTWVTCQMADPSIPLSPENLDGVAPPRLPMGSKVVLSGRMPNWLAASLAMSYHGTAKAVALFQPGIGATVSWTHSKECALGALV